MASPLRSPFVIESEEDASTLASLSCTPSQTHLRSLEVSPFHSPPVRTVHQLPTPSDSPPTLATALPPVDIVPETQHNSIIQRELSQDHVALTLPVAENPFIQGDNHEDLLVETQIPPARSLLPSMSMHSQASSSSALSFNTALSPPASEFGGTASDYTALSPYAEFLSFPPTRAASPFSDHHRADIDSDVFTLSPRSGSGDDLHSLSSRAPSSAGSVSAEHLRQSNFNIEFTETQAQTHVRSPPRSEDGYIMHDFDDVLSESSSNGWEDIDAPNVWH